MSKKKIALFLIIILTFVVDYFFWNKQNNQNNIVKYNPALDDQISEFGQFTQYVGFGGPNISDEKLVPGGTKPYLMRVGFPQSIEYRDGKYFLTMDLGLWFVNDYKEDLKYPHADKAMLEDGDPYGAPNNFYIRNNNHIFKTFEVLPIAPIYTINAGSGAPNPMTHISNFKNQLETDPVNKLVPFVFDLENNVITKAYQRWVP